MGITASVVAVALLAAPAGEHRVLAVLEFKSRLTGAEAKEVDASYLSNVVRTAALDAVPGLRVMTRENMLMMVEASGKKLEDCEGECEVDTGRPLGADLVISGQLLKFGTKYKLDLRMHDTREGTLLSGAQASGKSPDELDDATGAAVKKLLLPLMSAAAQSQPSEPEPVRPAPSQPAPVAAEPAPEKPRPAATPAPAAPAKPFEGPANAPAEPSWSAFSGNGSELTYSVTTGSMAPFEIRERDGGVELFNGAQAHYRESTTTIAVSGTTSTTLMRSYFGEGKRGIEMLGTRTFSSGSSYTSESISHYEPGILVRPKSLKVGTSWHERVAIHGTTTTWVKSIAPSQTPYDDQMEIDGKVVAHEEITTPAGTWRCAVLETTTTSHSGANHTVVRMWLAPAVGIVALDVTSRSGSGPESKTEQRVKEAQVSVAPWGSTFALGQARR